MESGLKIIFVKFCLGAISRSLLKDNYPLELFESYPNFLSSPKPKHFLLFPIISGLKLQLKNFSSKFQWKNLRKYFCWSKILEIFCKIDGTN